MVLLLGQHPVSAFPHPSGRSQDSGRSRREDGETEMDSVTPSDPALFGVELPASVRSSTEGL